MIKKVLKSLFNIFLILVLMSVYVLKPVDVYAASKATTLKELRAELSSLQAKQKQQQNAVASTKSAIAQKHNEIAQAHTEIKKAEDEIEVSKNKIEESNKRIAELEDKTAQLLQYYELLENDDAYMEYITGASTMTDLIMRMDAVDALVSYNRDSITELEKLIDDNKQLQVDLLVKQDKLESNIVSYEAKIDSLEGDLSILSDAVMDLDDQISTQRQLINYYVSLGCKEDQNLDECLNASNNASWLKPLNKGTITSLWGWRISPITGTKKLHNGIDIGGNSEGTSVLGIGSGIVAATVNATYKYQTTSKKTCGGNQVYVNYQIAGKQYTVLYAHLLSLNVKVGDHVTAQTVIGKQGGGSGTKAWETCSTGSHLHFGVSKGYYTTYTKFVSNNIKPPGFPGKGGKFSSRTQWFN
jgi:murein DD-endopeptidase MepM/ murein hydrolase activator NlpD